MLEYLLVLLSIIVTAALFGGTLFFAGVVLPVIQAKLPRDTAAEFLEEAFPIYYLTAFVTAVLAAVAAARPNPVAAGVLGIVGISFLYARIFLLPRINAAQEEGDMQRHKRLHKQSVTLTIVQIAVVMAVLLFLAIVGPLAAVLSH
ncbi:MAG TPA: DUF4149 domain-containing protein [Stellaceae bacterium]|nr:DUF4149 domain-containing protein [Stellaceae bacterium]